MKTLLIGNTGYLTEDFLMKAFPKQEVVIYGETHLATSRKKKWTVLARQFRQDQLEEIFRHYHYDQVVYFSDFLTFDGRSRGEIENLDHLFGLISQSSGFRFLYVTGPIVQEEKRDLKAIAIEQVRDWAQGEAIDFKIIYSPYLYSVHYQEDFFYQLFEQLEKGEDISVKQSPLSQASFISMTDLGELFSRLFERWHPELDTIIIPDAFQHSFKEVIDELHKLNQASNINFSEKVQECHYQNHPEQETLVRDTFGWFMRYSILRELPMLYDEFRQRQKDLKPRHKLEKLVAVTSLQTRGRKLLEILLVFGVFEVLSYMSKSQLQFQLVDLRLLFVVLISTVLGMTYGLFASGLAILGLTMTQIAQGASWQLLLYNTDRWTAYAAYIFIAVVCGFVGMQGKDDRAQLIEQLQVAEENYEIVNQSYATVLKDNQDLKSDLLASHDGYSQFYSYFERLNQEFATDVLSQAMMILEELVDGSVALYQGKADLYLLSQGQGPSQSLHLGSFKELVPTLEQNRLWCNNRLLEDYPSYAFKVKSQGEDYVFWLSEVSFKDMTKEQRNKLEVLASLISSKLEKATLSDLALHGGGAG